MNFKREIWVAWISNRRLNKFLYMLSRWRHKRGRQIIKISIQEACLVTVGWHNSKKICAQALGKDLATLRHGTHEVLFWGCRAQRAGSNGGVTLKSVWGCILCVLWMPLQSTMDQVTQKPQKFIPSQFWRLEVQSPGVSRAGFFWAISAWLVAGHFLPVSIPGLSCVSVSVCMCPEFLYL